MEVVAVVRQEVGQFGILGVAPARLDWIQLRSIRWQPLEGEPMRMVLLKMRGGRAVGPQAVPDQDHLPTMMPMQLAEKPDQVVARHVLRKHLEVQRQAAPERRDADQANHRETIPAIPGMMDRRLPGGGPGATPQRLEHEAAFIHENYRVAPAQGPLLIRGQSAFRQCSMASALRSRARCSGF